jgi:hypothetical protein
VLLLVRGGNIGRPDGSIAEAGSGILSRLLRLGKRLARCVVSLTPSFVSRDRCCREIPTGGDFCTMPVGVLEVWELVVMVG